MPLLKPEPDAFPEDVFALPIDVGSLVGRPRPQSPGEGARALPPARFAFGFYLPQREHAVRRHGRTRRSYLPLFPGYLFFRGGPAERHRRASKQSHRQGPGGPGPGASLRGARPAPQAFRSQAPSLEPCEPLPEGAPVRIVEGAFRGISRSGRSRAEQRPRLVVSISILRKAVAVELDRERGRPPSVLRRGSRETFEAPSPSSRARESALDKEEWFLLRSGHRRGRSLPGAGDTDDMTGGSRMSSSRLPATDAEPRFGGARGRGATLAELARKIEDRTRSDRRHRPRLRRPAAGPDVRGEGLPGPRIRRRSRRRSRR